MDAFRYFLHEYKDMAYSIAISVVKNEVIAEEVVQDAYVKLFNNLKKFSGRSKFSTWFYRIVVNEALLTLKKNKNEIITFNAEYDDELPDETAILSLKAEEQTYLINEALKQLPANESLALRLFYLEEEQIKTVCEITGWTESNTKVLLHRARKNMSVVLSKLLKTGF